MSTIRFMLVSDRDRYAALLKTPALSTTTVLSQATPLGSRAATLAKPTTTLPPLPKTQTTTTTQKQAAQRELLAHAALRNCVPSAENIAAAEFAAAQQADPRVTQPDFDRAVDRARRAKDLVPVRQSVLNGFTRVVDAKLTLTPRLIAALCADVGKDANDLLLAAIDKGPGGVDGKAGAIAFPHPQGKVELVASLVRQLVLGKGASLQLPVDAAQTAWLESIAAQEGTPVKLAMGGAGAFAANLMTALDNVTPRFFSKEPLPQAIAERFALGVDVVNASGVVASKHSDESAARKNTACEYDAGAAFTVVGRDTLKINGVPTKLETSGAGRVILGSKGKDVVPGFDGVSDAALQKMGRDHDLFFFVGAHYLTANAPAEAKKAAAGLATALDVMKAANPKLVRHLQYVVPKVAAHEIAVLSTLKGHVESLSMNAVEVPMLVDRLHGAQLTSTSMNPHLERDVAEEPATMLAGAAAIKEGLGLARVHLHGLLGDFIVVDARSPSGDVDVERTRLALLRARQLASMKATNDSGEIKGKADVFDVVPVVEGKCLAAVQRFADALQQQHGFDDDVRAAVVRDWVYVDDKRGTATFFVPSRGIHDRSGGTVSLGDTIDASALVFSRDQARPKTMHQLVRHSS